MTGGAWEIIHIDKLNDWTGASFVIRSEKAPGGICAVIGGLGEAEEEANANLFVAAKIMLETLETIADFAPGNGDVCEIIARRARAAIALATGMGK
jgi:hypothetical protein